MDAWDTVGYGCCWREIQWEVAFGGSIHGAFVCRGHFDTVRGWLFIEELEGGISKVDGATHVSNDTVVVVGKKLERIGAGDGGG